MIIKKYIGTKEFYRAALATALPIMIQNGITQFASVLDNLMVGRLGTEQMSGVAIANMLIFIYNLAIFGGLSGAGIFGAQFSGQGDNEGLRNVFRFKLYIATVVFAAGFIAIKFFSEPLIGLYLHESESGGDLQMTMYYGKQYLSVLLWGLAPFAVSQMYATSLRETGESRKPMIAGVIAVTVNLVLNYILIFGKLGIEPMGVKGAAVATVISRYVELAVIAGWAHTHTEQVPFFKGVYRTVRVPRKLSFTIARQGIPLLFNEILWASGMTALTQCYSIRGLSVVAATSICYTISNLFNVVFLALAVTIGIIVGNLLGAGKYEEAMDTDRKLIAFSVVTSVFIGALLAAVSKVIPGLYNTTEEVKELARILIIIGAVYMPADAFCSACYFTLRSGGRTFITVLFDSVYTWTVMIPVTAAFAYLTELPIIPLYIVSYLPQLLKAVAGVLLVRSRKWIRTIVD